MNSTSIAQIERATVAAVCPRTVEEMPNWLLPFDSGTVGRAISAVPLSHDLDEDPVDLVAHIEARYRAHGLRAALRLPDVVGFSALQTHLSQSGYRRAQPTLVQVGRASVMRQLFGQPLVDIADLPDAAWAQLFLGPGFDPIDDANRVKHLSRAAGAAFASVRQGGETVAGGAGNFAHGWASVHGMRTALAYRNQGLATQVLAALAQVALARGMDDVFLQVEEENTAAQALYGKAGFVTAWRYAYWRKPV